MSSTRHQVWSVTWDNRLARLLAEYSNRGHAIARLKGLNLHSWRYASEAKYTVVTLKGE